jgi:hypothetical protein
LGFNAKPVPSGVREGIRGPGHRRSYDGQARCRPSGTTGTFSEDPELPSHLALGAGRQARSNGLDLEVLGERLAARKEELLVKYKASGLPPPVTRSFTGHKLKQGRTIEAKAA